MDDDLSTLRTLAIVLVVSGALRLGWQARAGGGLEPGSETEIAVLQDSARAVEEDEARRDTPIGPEERLDPNTAPEAELDRLPGIGPALARRWIEHRSEAGGFSTPEDLLAIPGVGPKSLERIRPHLAPRPWGRTVRLPAAPGVE